MFLFIILAVIVVGLVVAHALSKRDDKWEDITEDEDII